MSDPPLPPLASLYRHRRASRILLLVGAAQIGLVAAGLPGWPCPILAATGVPCPGCGLTHACVALLRGDWRAALLHPVAPLVLIGVLLLAGAAILPTDAHAGLVRIVARVERATRLTWVVILLLFGSWIFRAV